MADARYWLALGLVRDVGPVIARRLLAAFGGPEEIFAASTADLQEVKGLRRETAEAIAHFAQWDAVESQLRQSQRKGIEVVGYLDEGYPCMLREIPDAPVALFRLGEYRSDDRFGIAVVGSRRNTTYGEAVTRKIAAELAAAGFTIVSGLARGIDTLAHSAALAAGGRTIAVLGTGLDVHYPSENRGLMAKIATAGCAFSEFPPGTMPHRENFPKRNRLISGLSLGVLVVEATADSGSLITAKLALEQNRSVFAVPGQITAASSGGTNRLIREGARLVIETRDIIEELAPMLKGFIRADLGAPAVEMTEEEETVCRLLTREPRHIDIISRENMQPVSRMLSLLLSLEIKGVVRQSSGKRFYLA